MSAKNERRKRKFMVAKKGNGKGGDAGEKEASQKKALKVIQVPFRGETRAFKFLPGEYALPVVLSLLSLDDPRVNAILNGFGIQVRDASGKLVFPEQPTIYPGEVQAPIDKVLSEPVLISPSDASSKIEGTPETQIDLVASEVNQEKAEEVLAEAKVEETPPESDPKDAS